MFLKYLVLPLALAGCAQAGDTTAPAETITASLEQEEPNVPETPKPEETAPQPEAEATPKPAPDIGARDPRVAPRNNTAGPPVSGLPNAQGRTFTSLDGYLAHLKELSTIDYPYWERLKDGRYRWNTGRGMDFDNVKYATRDELLEKYGFSE